MCAASSICWHEAIPTKEHGFKLRAAGIQTVLSYDHSLYTTQHNSRGKINTIHLLEVSLPFKVLVQFWGVLFLIPQHQLQKTICSKTKVDWSWEGVRSCPRPLDLIKSVTSVTCKTCWCPDYISDYFKSRYRKGYAEKYILYQKKMNSLKMFSETSDIYTAFRPSDGTRYWG